MAKKKPKRRTNRALLIEAMSTSYIERRKPDLDDPIETSHLQSMAQLFGETLLALARGAAECKEHGDGHVEGACPWCRKLWARPEGGT